jgi:signal peptidase II
MIENLRRKEIYYPILLLSSVVIFDQVTKIFAKAYLQPVHSIKILGNFLRFTYVENPGMAFGIQIANKPLFNILSLLAILVIMFYLIKMKDQPILRFAFIIILGGAFGNLIDRFLYGKVVDFIDVEFFNISFDGAKIFFYEIPPYYMDRWPVFNIADSAVSIGMVLIILTAIFEKKTNPAVSDAAPEDI